MRILVVDDTRSVADAIAAALRKNGDFAEAVYTGEDAIQRLIADPPDVVLTDMNMEPIGGFGVLEAARKQRPPVEVIMFTGVGGVDEAVRAMQLGARDFLTKPVSLVQLGDRLDELRGVGEVRRTPRDDADEIPFFDKAPASRDLRHMLERAAQAPSHVWIEGEIGSGRGQAAATLHRLSGAPGPLVSMEPSRGMAWPTSGTVVLTNVDDLPDDLQRDLVRQLSLVSPNVRIIATAGPDSESRVAKCELRPDLYFKLSVIKVTIPPLRDRREDIIPMLRDALERYARRFHRPVPVLEASEEARLVNHTWPGNVRELLSVAERAVVLGADALSTHRTRVAPTHLPTLLPGFNLDEYTRKHERDILMEAWRITNGVKPQMLILLGITRQNLDQKLQRYKIPEDRH